MAGAYRCIAEPALCYRSTKDTTDRATNEEGKDIVLKQFEPVRASDAGDGWLSVYVRGHGVKFLPKSIMGQTVMQEGTLKKCVSAVYYRRSRDANDKSSDVCTVGDIVCVDEAGEGWFSVLREEGRMFIPTSVEGENILVDADLADCSIAEAHSMVSPMSAADDQAVAHLNTVDSYFDMITVADPEDYGVARDIGKLRVYRCAADPALCYRHSKKLSDRVQNDEELDVSAKFGDWVVGIDEGDDWLSVDVQGFGIKYLPINVYGDNVMEKAVLLKCISSVCYREKMDSEDVTARAKDTEGKEIVCNMDDVVVGKEIDENWYEVYHSEHGRKVVPQCINGESLFIRTR